MAVVRTFIAIVVAFGLLTAVTTQGQDVPVGDVAVDLELVASGLVHPVYATHAGDDSGRLFVVDQIGLIRIVENGVLLPTPFLDLTTDIVPLNPFFDERGLMGLAFHPDYAANGRFFVVYSRARTGGDGEPCTRGVRGCHQDVVAEYSVSADPNIANPVGRILLRVNQPQSNHNVSTIVFGPLPPTRWSSHPEQHLFVGLGDGGGGGDGLAASPPLHGPRGHGQNIQTLLGAILRIDVDSTPRPGQAYAIPADNPFVGRQGRDEIYAYGFRNPYRFSFDDGPGGDGRLFVGDAGQQLFEEVNIVERGGNYGWAVREGGTCFNPFDTLTPLPDCATTGFFGGPLIDPLVTYGPLDGSAVIGGFVYRGRRIPRLVGRYVFGDFSAPAPAEGGRLFWLDVDRAPVRVRQLDHPSVGRFLLGFGEDEENEIYVLSTDDAGLTGTSGRVLRIVP